MDHGWYAPDHQFVVTAALVVVNVSSSEQVVRNIAADVGVGVAPLSRSLQVAELAHQLLRDLASRVDVALHVVIATRPLPVGSPLDAIAGVTIDISALRT